MFDWQTIKEAVSHQKNNEKLEAYKTDASHEDSKLSAISLLENYTIISVKGEDALKFLQGQTTCDMLELDKKAFIHGAHCNPKGRMISNFVISKYQTDHYMLKVHASNCETAYQALKKYSVFFKLDLFINNDVACIALHNTHKTPTIKEKQLLKIIPNKVCEFWADTKTLTNALLETQLPVISSKTYHITLIKAGLADVTHSLTEKLLPQEINLQLIDGISFNKGCYTGQEIIARLHYKGQLKKHMYPILINKALIPKEADALSDSQSKKIATIINIIHAKGNTYALIVTDRNQIKEIPLFINKDQISKYEWLPHPYAIPN